MLAAICAAPTGCESEVTEPPERYKPANPAVYILLIPRTAITHLIASPAEAHMSNRLPLGRAGASNRSSKHIRGFLTTDLVIRCTACYQIWIRLYSWRSPRRAIPPYLGARDVQSRCLNLGLLERNAMTGETDFSVLDDAKIGLTLEPEDFDVTERPPRIDDVIDLYKSFRQERDNPPPGASGGLTAPRPKVLDELSFSELFRLTALGHDVERPRAPHGTDTNARHAQRQEMLWQGFYNRMQNYLQERWTQQYGLVEAGGYLTYRRLLGKHSRVGYQDHRYEDDYPPCCDHTTLWRRKGTPSRFAEVLVTAIWV